jgi:hypothetical protein
VAQDFAPEHRDAFTAEHRDQLSKTGVVRLRGVLQPAVTSALTDRLWAMLAERHGMLRDQPETWTQERPAQLGGLARGGAFFGMVTEELSALLDGFFGNRGWDRPIFAPRPLLAFPSGRTAWNVPRRAWHLDGTEGTPSPDYVRIFAMLAPLEAGGGGTAYVTGSHLVAMAIIADMARHSKDRSHIKSANVIKRMRRECRWIDGLYDDSPPAERIERFVETGAEHRGVSLRVDEITGDTGDVIFWHPDLLHAPARNCRGTPRLALNLTVFAKGKTPAWAKAAEIHLSDAHRESVGRERRSPD